MAPNELEKKQNEQEEDKNFFNMDFLQTATQML